MCQLNKILKQYIYEKSLRPATVIAYECAVRNAVSVGVIDMSDENLNKLINWRNRIVDELSPVTWNNYLRHLRALGNFWIKKKEIVENPFNDIAFVKEPKKRKKTIVHDDAVYLINWLKRNPEKFNPTWFWIYVYKMLYYTGIRRGEIIRLKVSDVDFKNNSIYISPEKNKTFEGRIIPIPYQIENELHNLVNQISQSNGYDERQLFNITLFNKKYLGHEMTEEQLSGFFRRLNMSSGITVSAHMLRHSMATDVMSNGGNIKALQELLGHSDIRTTMIYIQPDIKEMKKNLDYLPQI